MSPLLWEGAAPPKPVWGEPTGTTGVVPAAEPLTVEDSPEPMLPVVEMDPGDVVVPPPPVGDVVAIVPVVVVVEEALTVQVDGAVMVLASRLTASLRAKTRPCTVAPERRLIDVSAMMFPTNWLPEPMVAELPTSQ